MSSNREIVTDAFRSWANGTGYVASIFAEDMTWEITGRSAASRKYANTQQFLDECLHPFGARFSSSDPFRPVNIRAIYDDEDNSTVIVLWDGQGTTTAGTTYRNTYAWFPDPPRRQDHRRHGLLRQHRVQRTLGQRHTLTRTTDRRKPSATTSGNRP